jgi:predicted  nucleic acid-binding Zn-ribbon protein
MKERVQRMLIDHNVSPDLQTSHSSDDDVSALQKELESLRNEKKALQLEVCTMRTECLQAQEKYKKQFERMHRDFMSNESKRRTEWEIQKTIEIKDQTIQQLAPDIERILYQHKLEKDMWERMLEARATRSE